MRKFKVEVLGDDESYPHVWSVMASTELDAIQLAFALDGGWGCDLTERSAEGMLELARAHSAIIKE